MWSRSADNTKTVADDQSGESRERVKAGWVLRQSKSIKLWKKRFLVLTATDICTYKSESLKGQPTSVISLSACQRAHAADAQTGHLRSFRVDVSSVVWYFRCYNDADKASWMQSINDAVDAAQEQAPVSMLPALPARFSTVAHDPLNSSICSSESVDSVVSAVPDDGVSAWTREIEQGNMDKYQQLREDIEKYQQILRQSRKVDARRGAVQALLKLGPIATREALPALQGVLDKSEPDVETRKLALQVLCRADAETAPSVVPLLEKALDDPENLIRRGAVECLGVLGHACPENSLKVLMGRAMQDPSWAVRCVAVSSIAKIGAAVPEGAVKTLVKEQLAQTLSSDEDENVQARCAEALGCLATQQEDLVRAVREGRSFEVRRHALEAIVACGQQLDLAAVEVIGLRLNTNTFAEEPCLCAAAKGLALASPGHAAERAAEILTKALGTFSAERDGPKDWSNKLRRCIVESLSTFGLTASSVSGLSASCMSLASDESVQLDASSVQLEAVPEATQAPALSFDDFESAPPSTMDVHIRSMAFSGTPVGQDKTSLADADRGAGLALYKVEMCSEPGSIKFDEICKGITDDLDRLTKELSASNKAGDSYVLGC